MTPRATRVAGAAVAAGVSGAVTALVARGFYSPGLVLAWALAVALLVGAAVGREGLARALAAASARRRELTVGLLLVVLAVVLRQSSLSLKRTQADEFALAWFTHELDPRTTNVFGPIPPQHVWNHQMPSLFHVVQKGFFALAGESPLSVKASGLVWVVPAALAVLLCGLTLFEGVGALAPLALYAVMAPSVYVDTFATNIGTSLALLAVFLAVALRNARRQTFGSSVAAGVACGLCYLGAPTSYVALPLLLAFASLSLPHVSFRRAAAGLAASLLGLAVALAPFVAGAVKNGNYLTERVTRVAPVIAPAVGVTPEPEEERRSRSDLAAKWAASATYLWKDDVGGCAGFEFGRIGLFDLLTVSLLGAGLVLGPLLFPGRRTELVMVALVVVANLGALGFANPPPMVTRHSVLFPSFALLLAVPLVALGNRLPGPRPLRVGAVAALLALVVVANGRHLARGLERDFAPHREDWQDVVMARFLKERFPGQEVKVAAFGGFHLEYILRFFLPGTPIETDYHAQLLERMDRQRPYVYVILFPEEFGPRFQMADPAGVLLPEVTRKYAVFVSRGLAGGPAAAPSRPPD